MLLGIEIGGSKLQLAVGDETGRIFECRRLDVERAHGAAGIRRQIELTLVELRDRHQFSAVGVGFGGPIDRQSGVVARSHQIEGWSGFQLCDWLHALTGAAVIADNDANVAALGEAICGAGAGFNPVFYVTLGSGVGGGLVVDGRIYHGAPPGESELGHLRLDRDGTILESRCSGWAVDGRIRELKARNPLSLLSRLAAGPPGGEARHLAEAWRQGDADARRLLKEVASDLALGLSHVVQLFHPSVIVLGGGLSKVGDPLLDATQEALTPFVMKVFLPGPVLRLSALGEDAVPTGALLLAALAQPH